MLSGFEIFKFFVSDHLNRANESDCGSKDWSAHLKISLSV